LEKILLACQDKTLQARIADSSSIKGVSFSSARTKAPDFALKDGGSEDFLPARING
jgi:hypothetical protein